MERRFTVAVPVRGTKREHGTIPKALGSISALNPDEILVALDWDATDGLERFVRDSCPGPCRVERIPRDPSYRSNFANVVYNSYRIASHDAILCTDADVSVTPAVLGPLPRVGEGSVAATTFLKLMAPTCALYRYRRLTRRVRNRFVKKPFAGIYWIWRPHYMDLVDEGRMKRIHNGVDTLLMNEIAASEKYDYESVMEVGAICHDDQTEDYPHIQFANGMWFGAHRMGAGRRGHLGRIGALASSAGRAALTAAVKAHPWYAYGYLWALLNSGSPMVRAGAEMKRYDWRMMMDESIGRMRDWPGEAKARTGYIE